VLRGRRFRHLTRGIYVAADLGDRPLLRFDAVRLLVPSAVASHWTAAELRELPVPGDGRIHVTLPADASYPRISGVRACLTSLGDDVRTVHGRPVLSVERTVLDLAATRPALNLVDLVILGDAAARHGWAKPECIVERVQSSQGRGVRLARRAAALMRGQVDSPMETRLRLLLVLAGLPEPTVNRPINDMGGWLATPDLSYPEWRIALEYDGDHHRTDRRQWSADKRRRRMLREDLQWQILECTADDVLRPPRETLRLGARAPAFRGPSWGSRAAVRRLARALGQCGAGVIRFRRGAPDEAPTTTYPLVLGVVEPAGVVVRWVSRTSTAAASSTTSARDPPREAPDSVIGGALDRTAPA